MSGFQLLKENIDIIARDVLAKNPVFSKLPDNVRAAKVFLIENNESWRDATRSLEKKPDILKHLSKLPFDPMAVEYTEKYEGGETRKIIIILTNHQLQISQRKCIAMTIFAVQKNPSFIHGPFYHWFDPNSLRIDGDEYALIADGMYTVKPDGQREKIFSLDTTSEMRSALYMMTTLAFLNSPEIIDQEKTDFSKLNKTREKQLRQPLTEYHIIRIKKHIRENLENTDPENPGRKFHWRRGHFKMRKTGVFWWNPHTAGNKELGEIKSDYIV